MKLINSQIKTLDDANNNYYLNKEYYTNIKNLFVIDALIQMMSVVVIVMSACVKNVK